MSELVFPIPSGFVAWESSKEQSWNVQSYVSSSGKRKTMVQQELPGVTFAIKYKALTKREVDMLMGFYAKCKGSWRSFFYKDYDDYRCVERKLDRNADGTYQCVIPMGEYTEPANKVDNVRLFVDGVPVENFTIDKGKVTVAAAENSTVIASYDYYYNVCFDNQLSIEQIFEDVYTVKVNLTVVR